MLPSQGRCRRFESGLPLKQTMTIESKTAKANSLTRMERFGPYAGSKLDRLAADPNSYEAALEVWDALAFIAGRDGGYRSEEAYIRAQEIYAEACTTASMQFARTRWRFVGKQQPRV
jgi:hypothetical protein